MERDFELEYKKLKQNETPDLWSRIEAGLSDKKIATATLEEPVTVQPERFAMRKQTPWKRWGLAAAACLGVVILFPAVIMGITGSHKNSSSAADTSLADEGNMSGSMSASITEASESVGEADAGAAEAPEKAASTLPELTDGQVLENVSVLIEDAAIDGESEVYGAVVIENGVDTLLPEDMRISVICDEKSEYTFPRGARVENALKAGECYTFTLRYDEAHQGGEVAGNSKNPVFYAVSVSRAKE